MEFEDRLRAVTIGAPQLHNAAIHLSEYDPQWPELFEREAARIRGALGERAALLEHAGSTAVPGLCAKPVIDIVLAVADSAGEAAYVPALEAAGYVLRIREPDWYEHRLFKGPDTNVNVHVFSQGCEEIERMLRFRDRLRANAADRNRYAAEKRRLAAREWTYVQNYADAKAGIVASILRGAEG